MTVELMKTIRRSFLSITSSLTTVLMIFQNVDIPDQWWILVTAAFLWDFKRNGE
jgi:hypothetical protein